MTHTYAVLEVSPATYGEVRALLERSGYAHAFDRHDGDEVIDMHGIALAAGDVRGKTREEQLGLLTELVFRTIVSRGLGLPPDLVPVPEGTALLAASEDAQAIAAGLEQAGVVFGPHA